MHSCKKGARKFEILLVKEIPILSSPKEAHTVNLFLVKECSQSRFYVFKGGRENYRLFYYRKVQSLPVPLNQNYS